jgi:hypothetical protein
MSSVVFNYLTPILMLERLLVYDQLRADMKARNLNLGVTWPEYKKLNKMMINRAWLKSTFSCDYSCKGNILERDF